MEDRPDQRRPQHAEAHAEALGPPTELLARERANSRARS
jgi:hypothetical protein